MAAKLVDYYYLLILYNKNIQNIYKYKFNDMYLLYILQQLIIKILIIKIEHSKWETRFGI